MSSRSFIPALVALLAFLAAPPARAEDMHFAWPSACTLGSDCWIVNYADENPGPDAHDFRCGGLTYDGHDGTDIALRDRKALSGDMPVLAAAAGTVKRLRDGVPDHDGSETALAAAKESGIECGNGVVLDHGNGWETIYCHMKQGSLHVQRGERVAAGDTLGAVGQTGSAAFPHLHFGIKHDGKNIDPFTGAAIGAGCNVPSAHSLWAAPVAYDPLMLYAAGFAATPPKAADIFNDTASPNKLPASSSMLIFWIAFYGARPGDVIEVTIRDPDGNIYLQSRELQRAQKIRVLHFAGVRTKNKPLKPGIYAATATVAHGDLVRKIEKTVTIE